MARHLLRRLVTTSIAGVNLEYSDFTFKHSQLKAKFDKREYRALELDNGMKVLLVKDPGARTSAIAMDVGVGSMKDPREYQGLAHFLEHLMFFGNASDGEELSLEKYLAKYGGVTNARTSLEHTTYHCTMDSEVDFQETLERFISLFTSRPVLKYDALRREVNAIDNEHKGNRHDDEKRLHQLKRSLAHANHPYSNLGTGNK